MVGALAEAKLSVRNLSVHFGRNCALRDVTLEVKPREIFGIIGPANSGKTSFLRALNRMDLFVTDMKVSGEILFDGREVRKWRNVYSLRRRIGVVFPLPVGLPLSIYDNVALAPRLAGVRNRKVLDEIV